MSVTVSQPEMEFVTIPQPKLSPAGQALIDLVCEMLIPHIGSTGPVHEVMQQMLDVVAVAPYSTNDQYIQFVTPLFIYVTNIYLHHHPISDVQQQLMQCMVETLTSYRKKQLPDGIMRMLPYALHALVDDDETYVMLQHERFEIVVQGCKDEEWKQDTP